MLERQRQLPNEVTKYFLVEHFRSCACRQKIYDTGFAECINIIEQRKNSVMQLVVAVVNTPENIKRIAELCFKSFVYNPVFNTDYNDAITQMVNDLGYGEFFVKYAKHSSEVFGGWYEITEKYKQEKFKTNENH